MADSKEEGTTTGGDRRRVKAPAITVDGVRMRFGQLLWIACVVFALFLAVGALLISLDQQVNEDNALVEFVLDGARVFDLGVFSVEGGVWEAVGKNSDIKNALVNYGLGAVFWLVIGRVLDRIVRP